MNELNIYLCGVGGQGIGMLSEILIQSCLKGGHRVMGVDTHGLAQRGGVVSSHIRLGEGVHTPRIAPGEANLVLGLERLEAYRAAVTMLAPQGIVVYYDCEYQPIHVRMGLASYPSHEDLVRVAGSLQGHVERVVLEGLTDPRMQNVALLGRLSSMELIAGVGQAEIELSMRDIIPPAALDANLEVFHKAALKANAA